MAKPTKIHRIQGREFCNELHDKFCELLGTDHRVGTAYHPQTNGAVGETELAYTKLRTARCLTVFDHPRANEPNDQVYDNQNEWRGRDGVGGPH